MVCTIPKSRSDVITTGHGSGGLLTHQLLRSEVFDLLENDQLDQQHDGASFELNGRVAFSTDSYVVSPVFFPGGNIGDLAVNGTVNDLAMCGADAKYLSLSFILEEGLLLSEFREIMASIRAAAGRAGVKIVTGDTKVVEKGKGDRIFINTSGIGYVHPLAAIHHGRIGAGDRIIISGNIASHGIAIMSRRKGLEFGTSIRSDTAPVNLAVRSLLDRFGGQVKFLRDPTRGGIATVLNEIAGLTGLCYLIGQDMLPMEAEVEGACELLGLDPLYVANEGIFLAVVAGELADEAVDLLRGLEEGKQAAVIGEVMREPGGKVVMKGPAGGMRVVPFLAGEQLPRIC